MAATIISPKPEYQKSTFDEELAKIEELKEQQKTPQKTEQKTETPLPTKPQSNDTEKKNVLIYLIPVLAVVIIVVFIMFKEKR